MSTTPPNTNTPADTPADPQLAPIKVLITRPDGSTREAVVSGHFREEHLCALVDKELSEVANGETLVVHLYQPDRRLGRSLRERWQEGLMDDRELTVREVLAPNDNPVELNQQLQDIQRRIAKGERINLAIRSPHVAESVGHKLRSMLLKSQESLNGGISLWVFGSEQEQADIMRYLDGMARLQDLPKTERERWHRDFWGPWREGVEAGRFAVSKKHVRKKRSTRQAVDRWIQRVERKRRRDE